MAAVDDLGRQQRTDVFLEIVVHIGALAVGQELVGHFGDAGVGAVQAVAVGDFVAERGADAALAHHVGDGVQAAADGVGAGVVVEDGRRARADGAQDGDLGGDDAVFEAEGAVELPPEVFEDFDEVRARLARKAAAERAVEVVVGADEARHDHAAARVDAFGVGMGGQKGVGGVDGGDLVAADEHGAVLEHAVVFAEGEDRAVGDEDFVHVETPWRAPWRPGVGCGLCGEAGRLFVEAWGSVKRGFSGAAAISTGENN